MVEVWPTRNLRKQPRGEIVRWLEAILKSIKKYLKLWRSRQKPSIYLKMRARCRPLSKMKTVKTCFSGVPKEVLVRKYRERMRCNWLEMASSALVNARGMPLIKNRLKMLAATRLIITRVISFPKLPTLLATNRTTKCQLEAIRLILLTLIKVKDPNIRVSLWLNHNAWTRLMRRILRSITMPVSISSLRISRQLAAPSVWGMGWVAAWCRSSYPDPIRGQRWILVSSCRRPRMIAFSHQTW